MRISKAIFYLIAFILLILLIWIGYMWYYFYTESYSTILKSYLKDHPNIYRHHLFGKQLFTPTTYQQALIWLLIGFNMTYLLQTFWWRYQNKIKLHIQNFMEGFANIRNGIKETYLRHTLTQRKMVGVLILFVLIHQIYMYTSIFLAMDESFSWLYFASQGVGVTMTHYPVPNNHVFYNVCSSFWNLIIPDDILAMRMTSLLSFWVLWVICYVYLYRKVNFATAYFSNIILGLGFSQSVFAVQSRGYMLCALLIVMAVFSLFEYLEKKKSLYIYIFTISCILGFYTIPVFLFIMVALYGYLLWQFIQKKHQEAFKTFFIVGLVIIACVYVFYLPILIYSGKNALIGNENVDPKSYTSYTFFTYILPIAFRESIIYVFSISKYIAFTGALAVTIMSFYLFKNRQKLNLSPFYANFWVFIIISLLTSGIIICVMRAFPFYRVWTYYAIFLAILLGFILGHLMQTFVNIRLSLFLLLMAAFSIPQFHSEIEDFYDPRAYTHHKNLENKVKDLIASQSKIYTSEEAFYIRFWLKYYKHDELLQQNSCSADVAIQEFPETPPTCSKEYRDIWFLRFYKNN